MDVASAVKSLRDELGLTQEALAKRCGVNRLHITMIERGRNKATSQATRAALAAGFGLTAGDLASYLAGEVDLATAARRARKSMRATGKAA